MSYGTVQAEKMTTESGYSLGAGNATSYKNRLFNGGMSIDQRNAGAAITPTTLSTKVYTVDRFYCVITQASKITIQQNAGSVTPPVGFKNYVGITSTSAYSVTSTDLFIYEQNIEGLNFYDLAWGTASAKPVTLSFWVYSSLTGTFGGSFRNTNDTRDYAFTYTINSANTWEYKTVTAVGDTTGTWLTDNGVGLKVGFSLGAGSNYSGAAGSWGSSVVVSATGATSVVGTNGATWYVTGVQLEVGTVATSFDFRSYGTELALCQRYYQHTFAQGTAPANGAASGFEGGAFAFSTGTCWFQRYVFPVVMRSSPSITLYRGNEGATDGQFATYDAVWTSLTSTAARQASTQGVHLEGSRSGVFTAKSAYLVSGNFTASAEL